MATYKLELTEGEKACGVTLAACADLLPKGAFFGDMFALPAFTPPALGSAVARCAFGAPAEFSHISRATGYVMYRKAVN